VFDVNNKRVVHLSAPPESCSFTDAEQELMLGAHISDDVAVAMCEEGRIDPHTMQPFPRPRPPQNKQQRPGNAYGGKLGFRRESGLEPYVPRYPDIRSHMSGRNNAADGKIASEHDDVNPAGAGKTANASARMRSCISTTKEEACSKKRKGPPGGDVVSWIATSMLGTSQPSMMGAPEDDGLVCVDDDDDHEEEEEACQRLLVPTGHKSSCKLFAIELQEKRQTAFLSLQEGPDTELQAAAASGVTITLPVVSAPAVAAQAHHTLASYSSRGPTSELRIKPDVLCPGTNINSAHADGVTTSNNCNFAEMSGTSMAVASKAL
jgi:hypothetical protein